MASGLLLSGIVAYLVSSSEQLLYAIHMTPLRWVLIFGTLGLVFFLAARVQTMKASSAQALFWVYAAMNGAMLSYVLVAYTGASVARAFVITAATFGAMSLYGYTTKRDLSGWGSFLFMGLIGVIIASVVNIFLVSTMLNWVVSIIGVLVFTGLTAYDTQQIKEMYLESDSAEDASKKSIMGALRLYLDFLNIFLLLLNLFGSRE
jgi:FtsH-binding integral membrane protein